MPTHGQTGLVIPVPAADALLASVGNRYPGTVREGLAAHVSLLYPFVVAAELDERFVALRPDPTDGLDELIAKTRRRWPDVVPYEGVYGDVEPHLTVAPAVFGADRCADRTGGLRRAADLR